MNKLNVVLLLFLIAMLFAKIASDPYLSGWMLVGQELVALNFVVIFSLLLFTVLFLMRLAASSSNTKTVTILFILAIVIGTLFIFQIHFQADDETVLAYLAYHALASGLNPYTQNFTSQLMPALASYHSSPTYLQNGSVVGSFEYPALYLLIQAPFFAILNPTASTLNAWVMPVEYSIFFVFFLAACYLLAKEKQNLLPVYSGIVLASVVFYVFSSVAVLLMLTLCMLMFTQFGKRHSWLILGLMVSLQQQLWIVALLFIAAEFRRDLISGFILLVNIAIVFIAINGYFIVMNPVAYFSSFATFASIGTNSVAPIAAILTLFGAPSILLAALFVLSIVVLVVFTTFKKYGTKYLLLLSAIPYLFVGHALPTYFALPFAAYGLIQD